MNPKYALVAARAARRCEYCRAPERVQGFRFDVEHVLPKFAGGTNGLENLVLSCSSCNNAKSTSVSGVDPETGEEVGLFHPRIDQWETHFTFDSLGAEILGETVIGRATVATLQMNSEQQLEARKAWTSVGFYP